MALYNRNKKITAPKLNKNLTIAQIIEEAGANPEYRAVFYERLLKDHIYVVVERTEQTDLTEGLTPNTPIITFENGIIPVFTDPKHIYDGGAITEEVDYIKVIGRYFLEMTIGRGIVVNPFSKFYKELIPQEIAEMLSGQIFNPTHAPVIHAKMNALIGPPDHLPEELIVDLFEAFTSEECIKQAHIGWTFNQALDKEPHYIIAIESTEKEGTFETIAQLTSDACQAHLKGDQVIDIIKLEKEGNFSEYFYNQSTPFYIKDQLQ